MSPTLFQGIAAASASGLLLGAAMQPQLASADEPPMLFVSGERPEAWLPVGWTGPGPAPDYVIGTDWLRPAFEVPADELAVETYPEEPVVIVDEPPGPPPELKQWTFAQAPPAPFPSEGGDILAGVKPQTEAPREEAFPGA